MAIHARSWQRRLGVLVAGLLALAVVVPADAGLRNRLEIGSTLIEITQGNPAALVGLAVAANPGLEKTFSYPLPRLTAADTSVTVPLLFLYADVDDSNNRAVTRGIDTVLFLTNANPVGGQVLIVQVTFRAASGAALNNPAVHTIAPTETALVSAIHTLNP